MNTPIYVQQESSSPASLALYIYMYSGGLRDENSIWNFACKSSLRFGERDTETQTRDKGHEDFFEWVFLSEVHQQTSFVSLQNMCRYHVEEER